VIETAGTICNFTERFLLQDACIFVSAGTVVCMSAVF